MPGQLDTNVTILTCGSNGPDWKACQLSEQGKRENPMLAWLVTTRIGGRCRQLRGWVPRAAVLRWVFYLVGRRRGWWLPAFEARRGY